MVESFQSIRRPRWPSRSSVQDVSHLQREFRVEASVAGNRSPDPRLLEVEEERKLILQELCSNGFVGGDHICDCEEGEWLV